LSSISDGTPAHAAKVDNSVRFAADQVLDRVDPYFNAQRIGIILADQVWDTLIYRNPTTGAYEGNLATSWRWIDDGSLELDLRQGVRFHDGTAFDADDVISTIEAISKADARAVQQSYVRWIDRVEKLGKYRIRILSKQPFPAAIANLASPMTVIHPREYSNAGAAGMNWKPIGTGPFRVAEHALGKSIRLERNPDYFKGGPKAQPTIETIEIRFIPDAQTRVAEIVAGGLDLIMSVAPDQAEQLRDIPSIRVLTGGNTRAHYLQINTTENTTATPLRDLRVRQAIMHAVDRQSIAEFLGGEGARVLHAECNPRQFGCDDALAPRYAYDPARARQLLAAAGYPNGFDIDFYAYNSRNEIEAIIGYLAAVGIRARLRFQAYSTVLSAVRSGRAALAQQSWSGLALDLSDSVSRFHEFAAEDTNRDPEIRDLLRGGDSSMDVGKRKELYAKALGLIQERAYVLPLYVKPTFYVAGKDLAFDPDPDEIPRFYEMSWK
jgi:peptide/nickel transport system substrate-binding protein